ncbi:MAG TPA: DUF2341 domain-containing protein, partial [Candidatus Dojkabacteria bacterium]
MDKQDKNKPYTDIVVLDDSIIVRYVLRTFLHRFSKKLNIKFRIYTSADGVEGLGYLYITNPDVIIIDTTLPKYSGRELIEYLLNNNKFKIHGKRIVVIHEEDFDKDIPLNFVTIDKRDPKFLRKLFFEIIYAADTEKLLNEKFKGPLLRLGRSAVGLSAKADALIRHSDRAKSILLKPFYLIRWLFMQIIISINIFIVKLFTKEHTDDNISQRKRDLVFFRVRYYPTLLALLIGVVVLFVQVGVYFSSGLLLFKVSDRTVPAEAGFPEFRVQRGTLTDFGASEDIQTVTLANPVGSLSSAFVRITNTMNISGGPPSSTSDQEADDMGVTALLTDTSTITFTRLSSGVNKDQRVEWEVIEYTGEPGGDNEFIVRSHTSAQIVSATSSSVNISGLGISNIDRVVPFQSGVSSSVTSNGGEELAVYMYLSGSNLVLNKGDDDGTTTVSYALVEFTGSNWGVGHSNVLYSSTAVQDRSMYLGSLGGGGTTFDVGNWNNAFIEYQHSSSTGAQANISGRAWKGSNTSTIFFDLDDAATGIQAGMAHIVSNSNISVQWIDSHTLGTDATFSTSITAVDSMSRTSIFATATSDQTGTDYSRQSRNYQLTSTTQVDWWGHRSSSTIIGTVAVVQWSVLPDATVTVSSTGTQTSSISIPSTDSNLAAAFVLTTDNPDSLSSITIREQGTVNGQTELTNIKMYYENDTSAPYDCASESFGGGESQFGSTDADGFSGANGTATFTGTADFTSTSALCLYTSFDVPYNASAGRTIEIDIEDPSSDVTLAYGGTVSTGSTVQLAGTTTLTAPDSGCTPAAGYSVCKKLTISSDVVSGSSDLTNFPYLLSGTFGFLATVANGGSVANSNGYDIIFTSDNGGSTQMDHEIERYIGTTGEILFWIRIPTLDHDNDTEIYMHYGNAAVSTDPSSTGTWDSNFKMVQHLEEITSGATDFEDSTANGVDSTSVTIGADAESNPDVEGQVDGAVRLDGSNDQIEINDNTNLDITGALTISYWSKLDAQQSSDYGGVTKYASYTGFSNQRSYALTFGASTTRPEIFLSTAGTSLFSLQSSTSVGTTDWHHIAATYVPSTRVRIYIDGVLDAEDTTTIPTSLFDSTAPLWIGTMYDKTS